eukprot:g45265.t1
MDDLEGLTAHQMPQSDSQWKRLQLLSCIMSSAFPQRVQCRYTWVWPDSFIYSRIDFLFALCTFSVRSANIKLVFSDYCLLLADRHLQEDQWPGKDMWKLYVKLLTPEIIEELKRDYREGERETGKMVQTPEKHADPISAADDGGVDVTEDLQKAHKQSSVLSSLNEDDGLVTSSQSDILRISKPYYARLYDMKLTDTTASQLLLSYPVEDSDDSTQDRLDQPLSLDELTKALDFLEKDKTSKSVAYQPIRRLMNICDQFELALGDKDRLPEGAGNMVQRDQGVCKIMGEVTRAIFQFIWRSKMDHVHRDTMHKTLNKLGKNEPNATFILMATFVRGCFKLCVDPWYANTQ